MNTRSLCVTLSLVVGIAACGKTDSSDAAADSVLAATPPAPKNPHIVSFEIGRQVDSTNLLVGGSMDKYGVNDTLVVAIAAQYTKEGDEVSARLRKGNQTIDSIVVKLAAVDSAGMTRIPVTFAPAKGWTAGSYQIETFLGAASQGIKEITVGNK